MKQTSIAEVILKTCLCHGSTPPVHINWLRVHPGCAVCCVTAGQDALTFLRHRWRTETELVFLHAYMPSCCSHFGSCQGIEQYTAKTSL